MLSTRLLQLNYYFQKLSLFMRNSYGIEEHFEMLWQILVQEDSTVDDFFSEFDILSQDAINDINSRSETQSDILDKIANIFGLNRTFDLSFIDPIVGQSTKQITLTNSELWLLLKATIVQNNYDGTRETCYNFYNNIGLPITQYTSNDDIATVQAFLYTNNGVALTENEVYMFLAGLFTIKSMGIKYIYETVDNPVVAVWDSTNRLQTWDKGVWA